MCPNGSSLASLLSANVKEKKTLPKDLSLQVKENGVLVFTVKVLDNIFVKSSYLNTLPSQQLVRSQSNNRKKVQSTKI
jgi:hypothetical protein